MTQFKRWYDHDPMLLEVMELLKNFQDDLRIQAQVFLDKIEAQVSKEAIDSFYQMISSQRGKRWYDQDPVLSKAIELLRIVPPEVQRQAAKNFMESLNKEGITPEVINSKLD